MMFMPMVLDCLIFRHLSLVLLLIQRLLLMELITRW